MKANQLAVQFYTLRDFCKSPADFAQACQRVKMIGYHAVELIGVHTASDKEVARICREEGLTICSTHEPSQTILDNPSGIVARLKTLGCTYTAYPYSSSEQLGSYDSVKALASQLSHAGAILREAGLTLTYHNHASEFVKYHGQTVLDLIFAETQPQNLQGELDTYWVQAGGGDIVAWCRKLQGRLPLLHLKDCTGTLHNGTAFCEIGHGNLNFKKIIAAAEAAGCRWFIVEQDTCPGDPFDSLRASFEYLMANLVDAE